MSNHFQPGCRIRILVSAALMLAAAVIEAVYGVKAERQGLEALAAPLSAAA